MFLSWYQVHFHKKYVEMGILGSCGKYAKSGLGNEFVSLGELLMEPVQWNLSVTTTTKIKFVTRDLFTNVL